MSTNSQAVVDKKSELQEQRVPLNLFVSIERLRRGIPGIKGRKENYYFDILYKGREWKGSSYGDQGRGSDRGVEKSGGGRGLKVRLSRDVLISGGSSRCTTVNGLSPSTLPPHRHSCAQPAAPCFRPTALDLGLDKTISAPSHLLTSLCGIDNTRPARRYFRNKVNPKN